MKNTQVINPYTHEGWVSHQTNLGVNSYDSEELWSPDTAIWKSKVLDLGSPKFTPNKTYWFDKSRYCNHGTITGALWKQLPSGIWYSTFDGDDNVNCGTGTTLNMSTLDFTMLVWFNCSDFTGDYRTFLGGNAANAAGLQIYKTTGKLCLFKVGVADATRSTTTITLNKWQMAAIVFDSTATTNNCQYYLDGIADGLVTFNQDFSDATRYVGSNQGTEYFFTGGIASAKILKGLKLTAAQVKDIFNLEKARYR